MVPSWLLCVHTCLLQFGFVNMCWNLRRIQLYYLSPRSATTDGEPLVGLHLISVPVLPNTLLLLVVICQPGLESGCCEKELLDHGTLSSQASRSFTLEMQLTAPRCSLRRCYRDRSKWSKHLEVRNCTIWSNFLLVLYCTIRPESFSHMCRVSGSN